MTDEEQEQLKRDIAEAKRQAAEARAEQQRMAAGYQADMRIIGDKLFREPAPAAPVAAAPAEDDDEVTIAKVNRIIDQRIQQPAAAIGQSLIVQNRSMAALTIPGFDKYAGEIDQLVARAVQANPQSATDPNIYRHAYDIVRLQHHKEIVDEEVKTELRRRLREEYGVEEEEEAGPVTAAPEAESTSTPPAAVQSQPEAPRRVLSEPPTAPPTAGRTLPPLKRRSASRLSEEQDFVNQRLGLRDTARFDEYANPSYSPDILGLNGRDRV